MNRLVPFSTKFIRHLKPQSVRYVGSQSWAYDRLVELGKVKEAPTTDAPLTLVTDELLKTPSPKVSALVDEILQLNVMEVHALYKVMEQMLGFDESLVYGARGGGNASSGGDSAAPAAVVEKVEEKTSFDVKIGAVDAKAKIKVIKEVRAITGLGLKEAKDLVEKAPVTIKEGLKKEEAEQIMKVLTEAGAEASLI